MIDTPHIAFPDVTLAQLEAEIAREWDLRRRVYPDRVAKGNMTQDEADWQLRIAEAWSKDAWRIKQAWFIDHRPPIAPPHGLTWRDRRAGLLRELELRRRVYPRQIASGNLLEIHATRQLRPLECLLAIYEDGWDWFGSDGQRPGHSATAAAEYLELLASIADRQGLTQQALAL